MLPLFVIVAAAILAAVWGIALVAAVVSRRQHYLWAAGAILCLPITVCCIYGFCASFEPGVGLGWKVGYLPMAGTFLVLAAAQSAHVFGKRGRPPSGL